MPGKERVNEKVNRRLKKFYGKGAAHEDQKSSWAAPFSNHLLCRNLKTQKYQPLRQFFRKTETENFVGFRAKFSAE